jgi:DNA-binding XRE family transcriptional regulator
MTLKELREKNKLSQAALAKSIGVSPSAVASIETGKLKPSQKIADAVKNVYGESIEVPAAKAKPAEKKAAKKAKPAAAGTKKAPAAKKAPAEKKAAKKAAVIIQSPLGGEITPEEILSRVGDVDKVYVRPDQNAIYWVKGEESGAINIW